MRRAREAGWLAALFVGAYWLLGGRQRAFEDGRRWGHMEGTLRTIVTFDEARARRADR